MHSHKMRALPRKCFSLMRQWTDRSKRQAMMATVFGSSTIVYNLSSSTAYEWNFASKAGLIVGITSALGYAAVLACGHCVWRPQRSSPPLPQCQCSTSPKPVARSDFVTQQLSGLLEDPQFGRRTERDDSSFKLDTLVTVYERSS